jgi:hypothetical protein
MHTILYLMYQVFTSHCYVTRNNRCVCLHAIYLQGQDPRRPLVIGVDWGIQTTSPHKGISPSRQLQPSCAKPCTMGVLRGSGNTQQRAVMVLHLNKFRTTVCCSKCGARTTAPLVCDYRTHRQRKFTRLREYPACKQQEQGGEGWVAQAGGGEGGAAQAVSWWGGEDSSGGGTVGEGDHAAVLAQNANVKKSTGQIPADSYTTEMKNSKWYQKARRSQTT